MNNNSGPAFPVTKHPEQQFPYAEGMSLRAWFATFLTSDSHEIDAVSDCDDQDLLERFGTEEEKDEGFRFHLPNTPMLYRSIELRKSLEARARARLRLIEADAMISELAKEPQQ